MSYGIEFAAARRAASSLSLALCQFPIAFDVPRRPGLRKMLRSYIGTRTMGRLFQSSRGTPLVNRGICRLVLYPVCERIGIARGGMHAFRHGRVSHMQASGMPEDFTKNQVGHSSLRITGIYTHFEHGQKASFIREVAVLYSKRVLLYLMAKQPKVL
jgi:integrase